MDSMRHFLLSMNEMNRRSLEMTTDVLIERIQLEAAICNLKLRIQEKELKKAEKLQIQEAIKQNKEKIENGKNFTIKVKNSIKEKVPIKSASWKNRKATICTVCEENCHEFDCWWVSDPSKHVKVNKKYIIKSSFMTMEFDDFNKEYEKAQEKCKRFSIIMDSLNKDLQDLENQKSILLFNAYKTIKNLSQIALKPDSAFTLQHLDVFIPRLKEAGKESSQVKSPLFI